MREAGKDGWERCIVALLADTSMIAYLFRMTLNSHHKA
jgi:hypothetical protein